jgi:hypothetical protein
MSFPVMPTTLGWNEIALETDALTTPSSPATKYRARARTSYAGIPRRRKNNGNHYALTELN